MSNQDVWLKKLKQPLPGAKRGRKRKHEKLPDAKPDTPQEVKLDKPKAKVGRKPNSFKKFVYYENILEEKRFNGDVLPSKRQRKPNSKFFSDYVVPANYNLIVEQNTYDSNYQSDSEFSTSTPIKPPKVIKSSSGIKISSDGKPKVFKPRIEEIVLSSVDDDVKVEIHSTVDPLDIKLGNDIVHPFLPMYNPPQVHNYINNVVQKPATTTPTTTSKIKEKKPRSDPILKSKEAPKATTSIVTGVVTQPNTILSSNWKSTDGDPSKLYGKVLYMPVILTTNSQNGVINVNDVSNESLAILSKPIPRWVPIQPKLPDALSTPTTQIPVSKKSISQKSNTNNKGTKFVQKNSSPNNNKAKIKLNDSIALKSEKTKPKALSTSKYVLVECDAKYKSAKVSDIDFNKLLHLLKSVKLPSINWKISITVSLQVIITEVIFTNKEEPERCVKFLQGVTGYKVTFGNAEVRLHGAPTLETVEDIATLLEIIHSISLNSHVLEYC